MNKTNEQLATEFLATKDKLLDFVANEYAMLRKVMIERLELYIKCTLQLQSEVTMESLKDHGTPCTAINCGCANASTSDKQRALYDGMVEDMNTVFSQMRAIKFDKWRP